ncbi:hypothetical protein F4814DRAFT_321696 [Daldinia grandis]|nr:hypothetical protein F4814DRAFT_321696 [Daldinia grandis]
MKFHDRHFVRLLFFSMTAYIHYIHCIRSIQAIDLRSVEYTPVFSVVITIVVCCFIYPHGTRALRYLTFTFFSLLSTVRYFSHDLFPVRLRRLLELGRFFSPSFSSFPNFYPILSALVLLHSPPSISTKW